MNRRAFVSTVVGAAALSRTKRAEAAGAATLNFLGLVAFSANFGSCDVSFVNAVRHVTMILWDTKKGTLTANVAGGGLDPTLFKSWQLPGAATDYLQWPLTGEISISSSMSELNQTRVTDLMPLRRHCGGFASNWQSSSDAYLTITKGILSSSAAAARPTAFEHHRYPWYLYDGAGKFGADFSLTNVVTLADQQFNSIGFGGTTLTLSAPGVVLWLVNLMPSAGGPPYDEAGHCKEYQKLCGDQTKKLVWPKRTVPVPRGLIEKYEIDRGPDPIYCPPAEF